MVTVSIAQSMMSKATLFPEKDLALAILISVQIHWEL